MKIIIKIGTKVLTKDDGTLDVGFLAGVVDQIVGLRLMGIEVVLVTSGAVAAGTSLIAMPSAHSETQRKQVYAAVGQVTLMTTYSTLFATRGYVCAQVLATKEDFRDDEHYANMAQCFQGLLLDNVIPIVNENDVVATTELMFTDNDELAGLVAEQLKVDSLVVLTRSDGVLDTSGDTVSVVDKTNVDEVSGYIRTDTSTGGRGGMISKFRVARKLSAQGITVRIVNGRRPSILLDVLRGVATGTTFQ